MAIIEAEFGRALEGKVKRKRNATQNLRSSKLREKAERVAGGSSEVMVKVTSYGKGAAHVKAHLDYITRNGNVEMENDQGEIFKGTDQVKSFFKDWEQDFGVGKRPKMQRDTMHLVLSMPENTPSDAVRNAVREFTKQTFGKNHEYAFVLHCPENDPKTTQPHCHVTVKMLGHNGQRLNPGRLDLANWREGFAEAMRKQGVDAEATRRSSRGVIKKAEKTVIRHIEQGDKTHKPRPTRVKALQEREVIERIKAEQQGKVTNALLPWEEKIKATQKEVRAAWIQAAKALDIEPPKPIYKQPKEQLNERPDYANLNIERTRHKQRLVALYQSDIAKTQSKEPPRSIASLRDLPGIPMVHNKRTDQVLLSSDARHRVGRSRTAGNEMRRQRISDIGTFGASKQLNGIKSAIDHDKAFAARIKSFVDAMSSIAPTVATKNNEVKQDLLKKFTRPLDQKQAKQPVIKPDQEQKKDAAKTAAPGSPKRKEQER
jgi:type IV secretory pathway VirD2 relaxase